MVLSIIAHISFSTHGHPLTQRTGEAQVDLCPQEQGWAANNALADASGDAWHFDPVCESNIAGFPGISGFHNGDAPAIASSTH